LSGSKNALISKKFFRTYLKPTDACHTKANSKKSTGIAGITSTIGRNAVYGSGRADSKKFTSILRLPR
jgi:hypothetical protein